MEVRYLAITVVIPLVLGGCLSDIGAGMKMDAKANWADHLSTILGTRPVANYNRDCSAGNYRACSKAWREISDADFCKRYSPTNKVVAWELERRKLDCSKLGVSASSK